MCDLKKLVSNAVISGAPLTERTIHIATIFTT